MSGQSVPRAEAQERPIRLPSTKLATQQHSIPHRTDIQLKTAAVHELGIKAANLAGRPIAPAPVAATSVTPAAGLMSSLTGHPAGAKVIGLTPQHSRQVLQGHGEGLPSSSALPAHIQQGSQQPTVMTISQQAVVNASIVTQAQVAAVPAIQALSVTGGPTLTAQPVNAINISMASLISRAALPHSGATVANLVSTHQPTTLSTVPQANVVHAFPSHVPRGAVAASALTAPKGSAVATAVLRPPSSATVQIPAQSTLISPISAHLARGQLLAGTRSASPSNPEATRRLVNVVTSSTSGVVSSLSVASAAPNRDTVQITVHQPRMVVDSSTRPLVSPLPSRAVTLNQPQTLIQQTAMGQKVMISTTQAAMNSLQPIGSTVTTTKSTGQNPVLNLSQHVVRPQKLTVGAAGQPVVTVSAGSIAHPLTSHPRAQKFVVSHASSIPQSATNTAKIGPPSALNLSQSVRNQKVVMATNTTLAATGVPASIAKTAKVAARPPGENFSTPRETTPHQVRPIGHLQNPHIGNPPVTLAQRPATNPSATAAEKPVDKASVPQQFAAFPTDPVYGLCNTDIYQNLVYQQLAQQSGPMRSGGLLPSQNPNLAATLQASGPVNVSSVSAVSTVPSTVMASAALQVNNKRPINLVTVDPSRSTTVVHSQFADGARLLHEAATSLVSAANSSNNPQSVSSTQPISSPARPSILRKRPNESISSMVQKKILGGTMVPSASSLRDTSSPATESQMMPPSPKTAMLDPNRDNSQSSTDTASSTESTPKGREEGMETVENGHLMNPVTEASPRKKPRKQLLHANEEFIEEETSSGSEDEKSTLLDRMAEDIQREDLEEYVDEEGIRWVRERKRPAVNLMSHYQCTWKTRFNHFQRYTDVKPKDERRPTVNELSNQKGVQQKASGWKMFHMAAQLEDMVTLEQEVCNRLSDVEGGIAPHPTSLLYKTMEDDISKIHELTQGNVQRCQLLVDQLMEAKASMMKVLDHRTRIGDIISRHHSKRPVKKKERT